MFRGSDACAAVLLSRIYSLLQRGGERAVTLVRNDVSRAIRTAACITP